MQNITCDPYRFSAVLPICLNQLDQSRKMINEIMVNDVGMALERSACSELIVIDVPFHHISGCKSKTNGVRLAEDVLWLASALFIIVFGDLHTDFLCILAFDSRIHRSVLYIGSCSVAWSIKLLIDFSIVTACWVEWWELRIVTCTNAMYRAILIASISFILISYALWPIWGFLTIPLLFTLLKATLVLSSYMCLACKIYWHNCECMTICENLSNTRH